MTTIEWTNETWNPVTGCTKVSAGCKNCYAADVAARFWADRKFTDVRTHPDRLGKPLRWRKPRRVFVNSMSDLFHEAVSDDFIQAVFTVMSKARPHTFQVLTKRPERMRAILRKWSEIGLTLREGYGAVLPNVWLGVSVEDQATADERIPVLLDTPAEVRFLSCEPLLGPVDLDAWLDPVGQESCANCGADERRFLSRDEQDALTWTEDGDALCGECGDLRGATGRDSRIDWCIVGGESGALLNVRSCNVEWIRDIVRQCREAGTACFVKQMGTNPGITGGDPPAHYSRHCGFWPDDEIGDKDGWIVSLRDRKGGDMEEWAEDLRVRQFPEVRA